MMENINKYLDSLTKREITGKTPEELRLNGCRRMEYERTMGEMFDAFRLDVLSGLYTVPEFIGITRKVEEAKKQVISFQRLVERTDTSSPMFRPLQAFCGYYRRQVEKTAELVESVNIMKLTQAVSVSQPALSVKESMEKKKRAAECCGTFFYAYGGRAEERKLFIPQIRCRPSRWLPEAPSSERCPSRT